MKLSESHMQEDAFRAKMGLKQKCVGTAGRRPENQLQTTRKCVFKQKKVLILIHKPHKCFFSDNEIKVCFFSLDLPQKSLNKIKLQKQNVLKGPGSEEVQ